MPDDDLRLTAPPTVMAQMGIRRPTPEVFAAFVDPAVTTRFWIEDSTGRLDEGASLRWTMNADGAAAEVLVTDVVPDERIEFDWGADGDYTHVAVRFLPWGDGGTHVKVTETDLTGNADQLAARAAIPQEVSLWCSVPSRLSWSTTSSLVLSPIGLPTTTDKPPPRPGHVVTRARRDD